MSRPFRAAVLLATALLASAPIAEARPGLGGSFGSRGSHSWSAPPATRTSPYGSAPFDRSLAPRPGGYGYNGAGYGAAAGVNRHPFASAFAGGLLGFGLGRMLFGHGAGYGGGGGGGMGLLGFLLELLVLFFVVRWLWRRFFGGGGRRMAFAGASPFGGAAVRGAPLTITPNDYRAFEQGLLDVQQAWSMQDLRALGRFATPEMVSNFSDQLSTLASRNLRNVVNQVRMEQGDLSEAWSENNRDYATVAMRYSMIDVTTDNTGRVVDGSPNERQMATELWTFTRARNGGSWLLSAIQQAR